MHVVHEYKNNVHVFTSILSKQEKENWIKLETIYREGTDGNEWTVL